MVGMQGEDLSIESAMSSLSLTCGRTDGACKAKRGLNQSYVRPLSWLTLFNIAETELDLINAFLSVSHTVVNVDFSKTIVRKTNWYPEVPIPDMSFHFSQVRISYHKYGGDDDSANGGAGEL